MKFSEFWLREWVNPAIDSITLAEKMTMAGLKVDSIKPVAGLLTGVIVGHIVACKPHPIVNTLRINKIDIGGDRLLDIICGAPNCYTNLRVPVATIGAVLPGDIKITTIKLGGEPSEGILCSFIELGISNNNDSLIELPEDAPLGCNIRDYLQLHDNTFCTSITSNRTDCLSLLGIARDVAAMNRMILKQPTVNAIVPCITNVIPVFISVPQACPRYLSRVIKNINVTTPTPLWMKEKLRRCGIHSVGAVIDITNFVLLELGQPMHAFDLSSIDGSIIVRMAENGEKLKLLDGNEVSLQQDTLVIASQTKVLAMAGILGGKQSSINLTTQDVVLECAFFNPLAIIGRARRYGLHTEASYRYERGVDPEIQYMAMERATCLLINICGGYPGPVIDVTHEAALPRLVRIYLSRIKLDRLLGYMINDQDIYDILIRLGCTVTQVINGWQVIAPSWRFDIKIEEDLIGEVARIYGYHLIPNAPIHGNLVAPQCHETDLPLSRVKMLLVDRSYQEVITYSFVDPKIQNLLHPGKEFLSLLNPISIQMSVMRLSLLTGLLSTVVYNKSHQQQRARLFESGLCFVPDNNSDLGVSQDLLLSGIITGPRTNNHWGQVCADVDFFDAKGDVEAILELTGQLNDFKFKAHTNTALHPGQSAAIYLKDEIVGFVGVIHPTIEAKLNLNGRAIIFELLWEKFSKRIVPKATKISRFPANRRDIAVIVAENVSAADVMTECKKVGGNQIVSVNLFDVYRGDGIAKGFKSLAISLLLQNTTHTLEEAEIIATVTQCVAALKQRFQASLRD